MKINLINYYWIFLFIGCIVLCLFYKSKLANVTSSEYLNKDSTDCLKGLSVLVVIFHHIALFSTKHNLYYNIFRNAGFLAVSIFLFLSGFGLMNQFLNKNYYFKGFYKKIINIYLLFFLSNLIVTIINNLLLNTNYTFLDIIKSSILFKFSNGRELWFVAIIIFMYISFYLSFKFFKVNLGILLLFILTILYYILCKNMDKGSWWYNSSICFFIGILFARYKLTIYKIYQKNYLLKLIPLVSIFFISMFLLHKKHWELQYVIPIVFILLVTIILCKVKLNSSIIKFINNISFEMYLSHLIVLKIAFKEVQVHSSLYVVLLFPLMIVLSLIIKYIHNFIVKIFKLA